MRSVSSMVMAPARTGSDSSSRNTVTRIDQTNSGILCSVMPGARMLKMVVMKLMAPRIDEAPARWTRQDGEIHGGAGLAGGRQRRIERPAAAHAMGAGRAFDEHRDQQQAEGRRQQPEGNVVHAREGHVGRADHQRHEPVAEAADHGRHDHEEDHEQAVAGDEHVVHVLALVERGISRRAIDHLGQAGENLDAGLGQFHAHHDGQEAADEPGDDGKPQIHRADVLVVGGIDIAPPARRQGVVVVSGGCVVPWLLASQ